MWTIRKEKARTSAQRFVLIVSDGVCEWSAPVWRTNVSDVWEASDPMVDEDGKVTRLVWGRVPNPVPWPVWAKLWARVKVAAVGEVISDE